MRCMFFFTTTTKRIESKMLKVSFLQKISPLKLFHCFLYLFRHISMVDHIQHYRELNKRKVKNKCLLPRIGKKHSPSYREETVFFKIGLWLGYHQIKIRDGDVPKTTFRYSHQESLVMYFRLINALVMFMELMN